MVQDHDVRIVLKAFSHFCPSVSLPERDITYLKNNLANYSWAKERYLLKERETSHTMYFLIKGLVRTFQVIDGKEVSVYFNMENAICGGMLSFFEQAPSIEYLQTIEPTIAVGLHHACYEHLSNTSHEFAKIDNALLKVYICKSYRHNHLLLTPPAKKFQAIITGQPDLRSRVPHHFLYSYFGTSKTSFNRMMNAYLKEQKKE